MRITKFSQVTEVAVEVDGRTYVSLTDDWRWVDDFSGELIDFPPMMYHLNWLAGRVPGSIIMN